MAHRIDQIAVPFNDITAECEKEYVHRGEDAGYVVQSITPVATDDHVSFVVVVTAWYRSTLGPRQMVKQVRVMGFRPSGDKYVCSFNMMA